MLLHRFAITVAAVCFLLLLVGGLVHNTNSGLACGTDWPRCHGVWMPKMEGTVLVEHGHRLLASTVGLLTVILSIALAVREKRAGARAGRTMAVAAAGFVVAQLGGLVVFMSRGDRAVPPSSYVTILFFALAAVGLATMAMATRMALRDRGAGGQVAVGLGLVGVGLVVTQGLLGALTVQLGLSPAMSTAHLGTSMLFFLVLVAIAIRTRPITARIEWREPDSHPYRDAPVAFVSDGTVPLPASLRRLLLVTLGLVYGQMLLGAAMRHLGAGMICGDEFPLCHGTLWPAGAHYAVYLHILHRATAFVVLAAVLLSSVRILRATSPVASTATSGATSNRGLRLVAMALPILVGAQIVLGMVSVWWFLEVVTVTAHLGVAATMLAGLAALALLTRAETAASASAPLSDEAAPSPALSSSAGAR